VAKRKDPAVVAEELDKRRKTLDGIIDNCGPITHLVGIDESGTGAWAGPFYLSAVLAPRSWDLEGVKDSKKTTPEHRERMIELIDDSMNVFHAEGVANPSDIEKHTHAGAYVRAMHFAMKSLMQHCKVLPKNLAIVVDGVRSAKVHDMLVTFACINILYVPKADEFVPHVGAASIFAKFNRDVEMNLLDKKFPRYYLKTSAGYGTEEHAGAIKKYGPIPQVHRPLVRDLNLNKKK
jgi:ribonuclease HII